MLSLEHGYLVEGVTGDGREVCSSNLCWTSFAHISGIHSTKRSIKHETGNQAMFYETPYMSQPSTTQLADSEMLCKEGRHDFSFSAACVELISLYLSVLIAWNSSCSNIISTHRP